MFGWLGLLGILGLLLAGLALDAASSGDPDSKSGTDDADGTNAAARADPGIARQAQAEPVDPVAATAVTNEPPDADDPDWLRDLMQGPGSDDAAAVEPDIPTGARTAALNTVELLYGEPASGNLDAIPDDELPFGTNGAAGPDDHGEDDGLFDIADTARDRLDIEVAVGGAPVTVTDFDAGDEVLAIVYDDPNGGKPDLRIRNVDGADRTEVRAFGQVVMILVGNARAADLAAGDIVAVNTAAT